MPTFPALVRQRSVWLPTVFGWCLLLPILSAPIVTWLLVGERFLSAEAEVAPEILIVDGWIHDEPIASASAVFKAGNYKYTVATGGYEGESWSVQRWSDAEIARRILRNNGVPPEKILFAQAPAVEIHRTYATARASQAALGEQGVSPKSVTVFTMGVHARRSRLIFQKAFGSQVRVGVMAWKPPGQESGAWWHSSTRAQDFIKETIGYFWELTFDSGRRR